MGDGPKVLTVQKGIGFCGLLTIVMLVLKATGYLNIPWLLVFAPVLLVVAIKLAILGFFVGLTILGIIAVAVGIKQNDIEVEVNIEE